MYTERRSKKRFRLSPVILGISVLVLLTLLVLLQSSNVWKTFRVETASDTLLLYALSSLNFVAFVIFGFIFLRSIIKLARERRTFQLGSRIKTRLLLYFAAVSLLPIVAMAGFSYLFMNRAIERWFAQIPENVVTEARKFEEDAVQRQSENFAETTRMIAAILKAKDSGKVDLRVVADAGNLVLIEILESDGSVSNSFRRAIVPEQKAGFDEIENKLKSNNFTVETRDGEGFDGFAADLDGGRRVILIPSAFAENQIGKTVQGSLAEFDRLKDENSTVRRVGLLTLGILTFLLIFASTWTAFYIARGLTVPIRALAEGAEKIAQGELGHQVAVFAEDELALLVSTFNDMSSKLQASSDELTERRRYIETVLLSLPTGVISIDSEGSIDTMNPAARAILRLAPGKYRNANLGDMLNEPDRMQMMRLIARAKRVGHASDQVKLNLDTANESDKERDGIPVALTVSALPENGGAVLVIEDMSELLAAQRASAWQEVARRMAHEIKNPLTPIQLSAERIAKRFDESTRAAAVGIGGGDLHWRERDEKVIGDGTDIILREVASLKAMVDEFSQFARLPEVKLTAGNINNVVSQVIELYQDRVEPIDLDVRLADDIPSVMVDDEQMKRVFVNLVDNAIEAPGPESTRKQIKIETRYDKSRDLVVAQVSDNGNGIEPAIFSRLFQPYFSTKGRGTGLGLAIVNRIIIDHHGRIKVTRNVPHGARFTIELPVTI